MMIILIIYKLVASIHNISELMGSTNSINKHKGITQSKSQFTQQDESAVCYQDLAQKQRLKLAQLLQSQFHKKQPSFYYRQIKNYHHLQNCQPRSVKIFIDKALSDKWKKQLRNAVNDINKAAPGLSLSVTDQLNYDIHIGPNLQDSSCYTCGNIRRSKSKPFIRLYKQGFSQKRTSLHQILHALGFQHQQCRFDRDNYLTVYTTNNQYNKDALGITPFDPNSVMLYTESEQMVRVEGEPTWKLKSDKCMNDCLSELDKVGLNLMYPPRRRQGIYEPKISSITNMYYCKRPVMMEHDRPSGQYWTKICGPNEGPNCPSCRLIVNQKFKLDQSRWQGYSGLVYCAKYFRILNQGHDGYCGPNNGNPCPNCLKITYPTSQPQIKSFN